MVTVMSFVSIKAWVMEVALLKLFLFTIEMACTTVWHENLTVVKFYSLAKLCRKRKLTEFNFTKALAY